MANTVSKSKIYIGTSSATQATDTYTVIGSVTDIGEFGDQAESVKYLTIDDARVRKLKGARDAGTFDLTVAREIADAGQIALRAAAALDGEFNIKIEGPDKPNANVGSKPTTQYLRGLISEKTKQGDANAVIMQTFTVDLTAAPVTLPPVTV